MNNLIIVWIQRIQGQQLLILSLLISPSELLFICLSIDGICIWQVLPQVNYGDACQIWMLHSVFE